MENYANESELPPPTQKNKLKNEETFEDNSKK